MDIRSLDETEMKELAKQMGEPAYRGSQLFQWVHGRQAGSFDEMTNLNRSFIEKLKERYAPVGIPIVKKQVSKKKDTAKYLFSFPDGSLAESVLMKYKHGNSVCISSQIGCRMGCSFCASTLSGLERSLTAGEMISQVYEIQKESKERISNIIVMGMGEPLDNYDQLLKFISLVSGKGGLNISQRNITVSTCGLADQIRKLKEEHLTITLAISLHAPNDEIRRQTMPVAKAFPMEELMEACREYFKETRRRITFEYSMIRGVNDKKEHAVELAGRLKGFPCHVNLIPLNEVKERECRRSRAEDVEVFRLTLEKYGINVTIRREMGSDIDAACGQLRRNYIQAGDEKEN